jgi:hypothetical protein
MSHHQHNGQQQQSEIQQILPTTPVVTNQPKRNNDMNSAGNVTVQTFAQGTHSSSSATRETLSLFSPSLLSAQKSHVFSASTAKLSLLFFWRELGVDER